MTFVIGVDIGGTFTDVVLIADDGTVQTAKGLSTSQSYETGILTILDQHLARTRRRPADNVGVVHGTTVATNAIIERRGAATGLITTQGFRDVLELRRIRVPSHYDLTWQKPTPLVERHLRREVVERIDHRGAILTPLDVASVRAALADLQQRGVKSIAVCLINAYANPAHERAIKDIIAAEATDVHVTLSSDILPEMREYERTSTTVINAYVMPVVKQYIAALDRGLKRLGFPVPLLLMQSNGGAMAAELAAEAPVHIIEFGPGRRSRRLPQARPRDRHHQCRYSRHRRHDRQGEPRRGGQRVLFEGIRGRLNLHARQSPRQRRRLCRARTDLGYLGDRRRRRQHRFG